MLHKITCKTSQSFEVFNTQVMSMACRKTSDAVMAVIIMLSSIVNGLVWVPKISKPDLEHGHGSSLKKHLSYPHLHLRWNMVQCCISSHKMVIPLSITSSITQTTILLLEFCILSFIMPMLTKYGSSFIRKLLDYRDSCVPTLIMHSFCQLLFGQHALGQLLFSKQKAKAIGFTTVESQSSST